MTAWTIRAATIALAAFGLASCIDARSQYAPYEGYTPPPPNEPVRPQYPIDERDSAPAPRAEAPAQSAPAPADEDGPAPRGAPTRSVGSEALPPVQRTPMSDHSGHGGAMLIPLVWRSGDDGDLRIDVARHRHLRPEVDVDSDSASRRDRRGRHAASASGEKPCKPESRRGRHTRRSHTETSCASSASHTVTVHKGDTIDSIADRLGTSPEVILKANKVRRPRDIDVGDKLKVPTRKSYVVKHGDTLYSIARRYDVPLAALRELNGVDSRSHLHVGQTIDISGEPPPPPPSRRARPERTRAPQPERHVAPPSRPNTTISGSAFAPPPAPPVVPSSPPPPAPPASSGSPVTPSSPPSHPVPYSQLPGALAGPQAAPPVRPSATYTPPTRPAAPYSPPAYAPPRPATPYSPPAYTPPAAPPSAETPAGTSDSQVAAAGRGRFIWPTRGALLSGFGLKPGGQRNDGLDIAAADGTPVRAAAAGDVVYAGNLVPGFGNLVLIKHEDGWVTAYAHLSATEVKIRDHVSQGTEIGTVGSSGGVDQPQLHFEVRYAPSPRERARPIDPALVLPVGQ
jgi:murein DD-endopeptidase MepM/ murein hydrolase activator NlpD